MWREIAGIGGHFGDDMETQYNGNFLKYVKAFLMRSPNNGGQRISVDCLLLPNEASSSRIGLHSMELLVRGSHGNPHTSQAVAKAKGHLPQIDSNAPLLGTSPTLLTEHGKVELVPTRSLHFSILVSLVWEGTQQATKREIKKKSQKVRKCNFFPSIKNSLREH